MSDYTDAKYRILGEIERLRREVANCAHCEALREQIIRLHNLLPPDLVKADGTVYQYIGPWIPPQEIQRMIAEITKSNLVSNLEPPNLLESPSAEERDDLRF